MYKFTLIAALLLSMGQIVAQTSISEKEMQTIRNTYKKDAYTKAVTNAVSNNSIKDLALNRENIGKYDHNFKYEVSVKGITDQKQSGRCWMFTSLNVLRPIAMSRLNISEFEFSTNYLYFWDIFEKSNLFLEGIIDTKSKPINDREVDWLFSNVVGDGGVWNSFTNLADKYGLVPKDVMPETHSSENTSQMIKIIKRKLREDAITLRQSKANESTVRNIKVTMLGEIYKILAINLGVPPSEFEWRYKNNNGELTELKSYTPKTFMEASIGKINFKDYIMLMDDPTRPYYKLYEIDKDRNVTEGRNWQYINLPASEIKQFALKSVKNNKAMYFSCDVGKQLNNSEGLLSVDNYDYESLFNITFGMDKKERILTHESGSSHGMALVGVDVDKDEHITKWKLENSWGASGGHNGYLTMTDKWFDEYMFRLVILRDFIDAETLKILDQKPTVLPPWDPMFDADK